MDNPYNQIFEQKLFIYSLAIELKEFQENGIKEDLGVGSLLW